MTPNIFKWKEIRSECEATSATLVAVSKTKPVEAIEALYAEGQRDFGENRVPELVEKAGQLPQDIRWHMIGHLQRNKVKQVVPIAHLIHGIDSERLLNEISKQASKTGRVVDGLMQIHIASEESKYGFDESEVRELIERRGTTFDHLKIRGLMGMATFTSDESIVRAEFEHLSAFYKNLRSTCFKDDPHFDTLSMGMSGDYPLALACGSNMVRVGSSIFGARN